MDKISDNKRIAKNTAMLYARMLLTLFVSLFTSRLVLQILGVEDYGLYSVVGGIVVLLSFLNGTMAVSTQRFLSFELGKGNIQSVNEIFCVCLSIHIIIAMLILIFAETVGLWFLYYKLNIPEERIFAAKVVYQLSIFTSLLGITQIPYNAIIIAKEKMNVFAFISIFEVVFKLFLVYLLYYANCDRLILYAILMTLNSSVIMLIYRFYCLRKYPETTFRLCNNKSLYKKVGSFAGWNITANIVLMARTQGVNMLINIYSGLAVNAARSIAIQVNTMLFQFVSNFQVAVNPQITKLYATGKKAEMIQLIKSSSKFSFLLLSLLITPFIFETETVLQLWLGDVPLYCVSFTRLVLIATLCDNLSGTLSMAALSTGNVKKYQIIMSSLLSLCFFISWFILKIGCSPVSVYIVDSVIYLFALSARLFLLRTMVGIEVSEYIKEVLVRCAFSLIPVIIIGVIITTSYESSITRLMVSVPLLIMVSLVSSYYWGLNTDEKNKVYQTIKSKINGRNKD